MWTCCLDTLECTRDCSLWCDWMLAPRIGGWRGSCGEARCISKAYLQRCMLPGVCWALKRTRITAIGHARPSFRVEHAQTKANRLRRLQLSFATLLTLLASSQRPRVRVSLLRLPTRLCLNKFCKCPNPHTHIYKILFERCCFPTDPGHSA